MPMCIGESILESCLMCFLQYASVEKDGRHYMSERDFVSRYLQLLPEGTANSTVEIYSRIADTTGNGWGLTTPYWGGGHTSLHNGEERHNVSLH